MTISVRLLAPFAAWLRPRAREMARLASLGKPVARRLLDGYVLSASRAARIGIASIMDTPTRFLSYGDSSQPTDLLMGGPRHWYRYGYEAPVVAPGGDDPRTAFPAGRLAHQRFTSHLAELEGGESGMQAVIGEAGFLAGDYVNSTEGLGYFSRCGYVGNVEGGTNEQGYLAWVLHEVGGNNWYGHLSGAELAARLDGFGLQHRVVNRPQRISDSAGVPFNSTRYQVPRIFCGRYPARAGGPDDLKPLADAVLVCTASKSSLPSARTDRLRDWLHDGGLQGIMLSRLALSERTLQWQIDDGRGYKHQQALDWATVLRLDQMTDPRLQPERWRNEWYDYMRYAEQDGNVPAGSFVPRQTGSALGWVRNTITSMAVAYNPAGAELTAFFTVEFGRQAVYPGASGEPPTPYLYLSWVTAAVRVTGLNAADPVVHPVQVLFADSSVAPDNPLYAQYASGNAATFSKPECLGAVYQGDKAVLVLALESAVRGSGEAQGAIWRFGLVDGNGLTVTGYPDFTVPGGPYSMLGGHARATPPTLLRLYDSNGLLLESDPGTVQATAYSGNDFTWLTDAFTGGAYIDAFPFYKPRHRVARIADRKLVIGARAIGAPGQPNDPSNVGILQFDALAVSLQYRRASPASYYNWGFPAGTPCVSCYQLERQYADYSTPAGLILSLPPGNLSDDTASPGNGSYLSYDGGANWFKLGAGSSRIGVFYLGQVGAQRLYGQVYEENGRG